MQTLKWGMDTLMQSLASKRKRKLIDNIMSKPGEPSDKDLLNLSMLHPQLANLIKAQRELDQEATEEGNEEKQAEFEREKERREYSADEIGKLSLMLAGAPVEQREQTFMQWSQYQMKMGNKGIVQAAGSFFMGDGQQSNFSDMAVQSLNYTAEKYTSYLESHRATKADEREHAQEKDILGTQADFASRLSTQEASQQQEQTGLEGDIASDLSSQESQQSITEGFNASQNVIAETGSGARHERMLSAQEHRQRLIEGTANSRIAEKATQMSIKHEEAMARINADIDSNKLTEETAAKVKLKNLDQFHAEWTQVIGNDHKVNMARVEGQQKTAMQELKGTQEKEMATIESADSSVKMDMKNKHAVQVKQMELDHEAESEMQAREHELKMDSQTHANQIELLSVETAELLRRGTDQTKIIEFVEKKAKEWGWSREEVRDYYKSFNEDWVEGLPDGSGLDEIPENWLVGGS